MKCQTLFSLFSDKSKKKITVIHRIILESSKVKVACLFIHSFVNRKFICLVIKFAYTMSS